MMPTHAPTPCLESGCFNLAIRGRGGRCAQCLLVHGGPRGPYDQQRGSARERGYNRAWEKRRKAWLELEPFCRLCGAPGKEVDHVIPHRGARWLFDLKGNLQTLCKADHTKKTSRERTIPIGMMYPLDLPEAPHYRPTRLLCGPSLGDGVKDTDEVLELDYFTDRGKALTPYLQEETDTGLTVLIAAPRTAERAFWSYVLDVEAELQEPPIEWVVDAHPRGWWTPYMIDSKAEEAMAKRLV